MSNFFTFIDRVQYNVWRADWKARYKELSQQIRAAKKLRNEAHSKYGKTRHSAPPNVARTLRYEAVDAQYEALQLKQKANILLEELRDAKEEAQLQYLADKEMANG